MPSLLRKPNKTLPLLKDPDEAFGRRLWQKMIEEEPECDAQGAVFWSTLCVLEDAASEYETASEAIEFPVDIY